MTYFQKLHPWCIIRPVPNLQQRIVARFRRRNEAEAHLQIIRQLIPNVSHTIIFDPNPEQEDNGELSVSEAIPKESVKCDRQAYTFPDASSRATQGASSAPEALEELAQLRFADGSVTGES